MAYRFRRKESAATGFRRIIREQSAASVSLLADRGNEIGNRVHEARRHIKRMRALLRLVRHTIDPKVFAAEDKALSAAARQLSTARDADVCLATYEALIRRQPKTEHQEIREVFEERVRRARRAVTRAQLGKLAIAVRKSGLQVADASLEADGWKLIHAGLQQTLRRARKLRPATKDVPEDAVLHEWRKWLKRLSYQMELLAPILAKPQRKMARNVECISDLLGKHHDLHVLEQCLRQDRARDIAGGEEKRVECLSQQRRRQLLRRIQKLSAAIFREKTKCVLQRIHAAWKSRKE